MTILIVEDDENKRVQLSQFLQMTIPDEQVKLQRSLQSGVRTIRKEQFDFIILDMTLPQYDISPDEPSDDTHIFGGQEFLAQMERFNVKTPVVVFTQFELFGKAPDELNLESLDVMLKKDFPAIYQGLVYYHSSINSWKQQLISKLQAHGFNCKEDA